MIASKEFKYVELDMEVFSWNVAKVESQLGSQGCIKSFLRMNIKKISISGVIEIQERFCYQIAVVQTGTSHLIAMINPLF